jgi:hypothetical protein
MSKKEKQPKVAKTIKVKTLCLWVFNIVLVASVIGATWYAAYNTGYSQGKNNASETDAIVLSRIKEVKGLMAELKK